MASRFTWSTRYVLAVGLAIAAWQFAGVPPTAIASHLEPAAHSTPVLALDVDDKAPAPCQKYLSAPSRQKKCSGRGATSAVASRVRRDNDAQAQPLRWHEHIPFHVALSAPPPTPSAGIGRGPPSFDRPDVSGDIFAAAPRLRL